MPLKIPLTYFVCEFPNEETTDCENEASRPVLTMFSEWLLDKGDVQACIKAKKPLRFKSPLINIVPREQFQRIKKTIEWTETVGIILAENPG